MKLLRYGRILLTVSIFMLQISISSANEGLFKEARTLQRDGHFDDAIAAYKDYLSQHSADDALSGDELAMYTDALVQLMNSYQSKGEPENCITTLQEVFDSSPASGHMSERLLFRHGLCLVPYREYEKGGRDHDEGSYSSAA